MFCPDCGNALNPNITNCPRCNKAVNSNNTNTTEPFQPAPSSVPVKETIGGNINKVEGTTITEGSGVIVDFLTFRLMITPIIMKIFYALGALGIGILTLIAMFTGGIPGFFLGIIVGLVMQVFFRIICEQMILFFTIKRELTDLKNKL
jgi:hypothetical protein